MAFTTEKDKPQTSGLNFREFRGIMTPSSVMGSIGRVPGGPLSRNEKTRNNRGSYITNRYGNQKDAGSIQQGYGGYSFPDTGTSRIEEDGIQWANGSVHINPGIESTIPSIYGEQNIHANRTFHSKAQKDKKKGVFQNELQ